MRFNIVIFYILLSTFAFAQNYGYDKKYQKQLSESGVEINEEQKNTQTETQETGSKFDVFKQVGSSALESIQGGFDGLLGKIQNISPEATAITETLTGLGVGGVVGVTAVAGAVGGMALAIKTGVSQAMELDDAMAKFQAQTGASSSEMNKFKNIARDV